MKLFSCITLIWFTLIVPTICFSFPLQFIDSAGSEIHLSKRPERIVSLVPSITEMIVGIGASNTLVGITHHSSTLDLKGDIATVGGFLTPDPGIIKSLKPEIIFYSNLHADFINEFERDAVLINLNSQSIQESFEHLTLLGTIFSCADKSEEIIQENRQKLNIIEKKISKIPEQQRKRVVRLMDRDNLLVPGDDSFQNEYIVAAGGIAPLFGKTGAIISLNVDEWQEYNPQIIYNCGGSNPPAILAQAGFKDVEAVRNGAIFSFPCELTCRVSTHTGDFVGGLAAKIYQKEFSLVDQQLMTDSIVAGKKLEIELNYLEKAEIAYSNIRDFRNKTLLLHFNQPMKILSSLEGFREDVVVVGNHYFPPPSWGLGHDEGVARLRTKTLSALSLPEATTALLFTGADMDNVSHAYAQYKEMKVTALVTAGVLGNALRMSADTGSYYEPDSLPHNQKPGTINIVLLSNMKLSPRAMTRAIISATEAKSAALSDLDIRSTYSSLNNPATGTGTDNIIVVAGAGIPIDGSGGHTKMGELIGRAVYKGVQEAILRQNGLTVNRSIFQRLRERKLDLRQISTHYTNDSQLPKALEKLLLKQQYSSFLAAALAISDSYENGLLVDISSYTSWCRTVAHQIAGKPVQILKPTTTIMPVVIQKGFSALISGILAHNPSTKPDEFNDTL